MVISKRGGNNMFIDIKDVERISADVMDAAIRELPRAMKMAPSEDIVNLVIKGSNMVEIDRSADNAGLVQDVMQKLSDVTALCQQLKTNNAALVADNKALAAKIGG